MNGRDNERGVYQTMDGRVPISSFNSSHKSFAFEIYLEAPRGSDEERETRAKHAASRPRSTVDGRVQRGPRRVCARAGNSHSNLRASGIRRDDARV